ncbi:U4/U6 small nuclear ribonucleoprotein PRP4-like protein, partial [Tanacetum coccineum]
DDDFGPEYEVSEESRLFREKQEKAKADFLMKQRAVPTNDKAVRSRLGRLGEPVTLFGEREMDRRDRLRMIMASLDSQGQLETLIRVLQEEEEGGGVDEGDEIQYVLYRGVDNIVEGEVSDCQGVGYESGGELSKGEEKER